MNMNSLIRWFDPNATYRTEKRKRAAAQAKELVRVPPPVWVQYLFFSLGVFVSPLIREYRSLGKWPDLRSAHVVGAAIFALITGFIVFPKVLDSLAKPDASAFSRLSTVFTAGIGWEQVSGLPAALVQK